MLLWYGRPSGGTAPGLVPVSMSLAGRLSGEPGRGWREGWLAPREHSNDSRTPGMGRMGRRESGSPAVIGLPEMGYPAEVPMQGIDRSGDDTDEF